MRNWLQTASTSLLPPAGEGGAQRRMRGASRFNSQERPHLPFGHPLPQAGEATAGNAALCGAAQPRPQAATPSLLPPAGEGGAQRRMRGAFHFNGQKRPHLPFGHPLPQAGEATAGNAALCGTTPTRPQAANLSLLPPAGEGGAQRRMRGASRFNTQERPHLPFGHPLPHAGEATAGNAALCGTTQTRPQAANLSLLPPAGEGGAQRRMRDASRFNSQERPHLPFGHPLPQAGEATAGNAALCGAAQAQPQATMPSLLPPAGEGGAQRRMRGAFHFNSQERPHLPFGHPLPRAGEAKAGTAPTGRIAQAPPQATNHSPHPAPGPRHDHIP